MKPSFCIVIERRQHSEIPSGFDDFLFPCDGRFVGGGIIPGEGKEGKKKEDRKGKGNAFHDLYLYWFQVQSYA